MERHRFTTPLRIWTRPNRATHVADVERAAEIMLNDWPKEWQEAASLRAAKKAALAVLEGSKPADACRKAFENAAREAKLLDLDS